MKILAVLSCAAFVAGGGVAASASTNKESTERQMQKLKIKINYAKRFIKNDRVVIAAGVEWIPLGAHVQMLDPHPNVAVHKHHMRLMKSIVKRSRVKLAQLKTAYRRFLLPPHYSQWLCIHRYEGSWTDSGSPYYGGLQFGYSEWHKYGTPYAHTDTADQASWLEQMWAAERYWRVAGFYPWPATARSCGLI